MKQPLHIIIKRMARHPLHLQIMHLRNMLANEKPRSERYGEIKSLLDQQMVKQLKSENRLAS